MYGSSRVCLPALKAAGLPAIHFHDLRNAGNTLAASAGVSLRELMERMGQDSERAALEASLLKIIRGSEETGPDLQGKLGARARLERATYCLGGTAAPALYRPATTHVISERNRVRTGPRAWRPDTLGQTVRRWWFEADAWRDPDAQREFLARVERYQNEGPPPPEDRISREEIRAQYGV